jgi:hypothetical protein
MDLMLDKHAARFEQWLKQQLAEGHLTKIPAARGSPFQLRYEWAAQRYCLRKQFKEMASDKYSAERIRKAVQVIFRDTGLRERK